MYTPRPPLLPRRPVRALSMNQRRPYAQRRNCLQASLPRLSHAVGVSHRQRSPRSIEEATDYSAEETMNLIAQSLDAEHRARLRFASQSPANVDQIRKRENELGFLGKDKDGWYVCNVCWPKGKSASTSHLMSWSHVKRTMLYSVRGWNSV